MPNDFGRPSSVDNLLEALKGPQGTEVIYSDGAQDRWEEIEGEDGTVFKVPKGFSDEQVKTYIKAQQVAAKSQQALGPEPNSPLNPKQEGPISAVQGVIDMMPVQMPQMPSGPLDALQKVAMGGARAVASTNPVGQAAMHAPDAYEMIMKMLSSVKDSRNSPLTRASEGLGYGMAAAIPGMGPGAARGTETMVDSYAQGEPIKASAQALTLIAPLLLGLNKTRGLSKPQGPTAIGEARASIDPSRVQAQNKVRKDRATAFRDTLAGKGKVKLFDPNQAIEGIMEVIGGKAVGSGLGRFAGLHKMINSFFKREQPPIRPVAPPLPAPKEALPATMAPTPYRAKEGIVRNVSTSAPEPTSAAKSGPVKGGKVLAKIEKKETIAAKKAAEKVKAEQKAIKEANKPFRGPRSSLAAPGWERIIRNAKGQFMRVEESA